MHHYVMFFRATRTLTPAENEKRTAELHAWIEHTMSMGIHLEPRNLEKTGVVLRVENNEVASHEDQVDSALVTMVFFDASSWEQALEIARAHPAPHYGTTLELREWKPPATSLAVPAATGNPTTK